MVKYRVPHESNYLTKDMLLNKGEKRKNIGKKLRVLQRSSSDCNSLWEERSADSEAVWRGHCWAPLNAWMLYCLRPQSLCRTRKAHKDDMFAWRLPVGAPMYYLDLIISSPADRGFSVEPLHHRCLNPASRGLSNSLIYFWIPCSLDEQAEANHVLTSKHL